MRPLTLRLRTRQCAASSGLLHISGSGNRWVMSNGEIMMISMGNPKNPGEEMCTNCHFMHHKYYTSSSITKPQALYEGKSESKVPYFIATK